MNFEEYFQSLSKELGTLKERVRLLIKDQHWPTDGEWKESVLRSMIRRSAPENVSIGRGFVVKHEECSSQIDVLIYDNSFPVLYKEGDLVFLTPDSCKAIVEVKSRLGNTDFSTAVDKLVRNAEFVRRSSLNSELFVGLFSYEFRNQSSDGLLNVLQSSAQDEYERVINHVSLGEDIFIKFWNHSPNAIPGYSNDAYPAWHQYELPRMAQGYFIHNLVAESCTHLLARSAEGLFPVESKEALLRSQLSLQQNS